MGQFQTTPKSGEGGVHPFQSNVAFGTDLQMSSEPIALFVGEGRVQKGRKPGVVWMD